METVCVTGATGSIGSALVRRLADNGVHIRALARQSPSDNDPPLSNISYVNFDLLHPESAKGIFDGCSTVYHCAAKLTGPDGSDYEAVNVRGTEALLEEAVQAGVERFIYASSITVYGFPHRCDVTEDEPWLPTPHLYSLTKQAAERLVWDYRGRLPVVIVRIGDVIGPEQRVWTTMPFQVLRQRPLFLPSGSGFMNPVYIDNLIDALLLLGSHPHAVDEAFNVVDGTPIPMAEYFSILATIAHRRPTPIPFHLLRAMAAGMEFCYRLRGMTSPVRAADIDFLRHRTTFSNQKIREVVGWTPAVSFDEAMRRTEEWLSVRYLQPSPK